MAVFRNLVIAVTLGVSAAIVWAVGFPETPVGGRVLTVLTVHAGSRGSNVFYQYTDRNGALKIVDDIARVPPEKRASVQRVEPTGKKLQQFRSDHSNARK